MMLILKLGPAYAFVSVPVHTVTRVKVAEWVDLVDHILHGLQILVAAETCIH